ncbi:hypothetical protein L9F63_023217, partial [Diploptera punctata]
ELMDFLLLRVALLLFNYTKRRFEIRFRYSVYQDQFYNVCVHRLKIRSLYFTKIGILMFEEDLVCVCVVMMFVLFFHYLALLCVSPHLIHLGSRLYSEAMCPKS